MEYKDLLNKLLNQGRERIEELEAFLVKKKEIDISVYEGEVSKYSIAESGGLSLRGLSNNKMGYSYTEKLDESSFNELINDVIENAKYIDEDPEDIFSGSDNYEEQDNFSKELKDVMIEDKIKFLLDLEKEALNLDERVSKVNICSYNEFENERYILNTKNVDLYDKSNGAMIYISVIVKDGEDTKTGMNYKIFNNLSDLNLKEIAKEAVDNGISMLGAKTIKSDNYPIVFENKTFANLISAFSSIFIADNVQKGLSLLKGKLGKEIGSPILTIVDDPFLEDGFASRNFDDEGTSTRFKKIVDNGKLKNYLYNWKTANKDEVESTGNASRSYKGSISTSPTNLYIVKGDMSLWELMSYAENGLYINNLEGLHSGLNPVSGDFSLSASGYRIVYGDITEPVNQITIAGNLFELFKDIDVIGNDLEFGILSNGYIGSPSVLIRSLTVSGE